jgi:hypothetical protein
MPKQKQKSKGISMIEALVGVFLLAVLALGIYAAYAFGLKMAVQNRQRTEATVIAEKKIEAIRAMNYADVGTQGGLPAGVIPTAETENYNGTNYSVRTSIRYIDDVLDRKFPSDTDPADYKQVEVRVNWPTNLQSKYVILNTFFSPPKVDSASGMGVLMINAVDSSGTPIANAHVHVVNSVVRPTINLTEDTDNNGSLTLPGAPITTTNSYEITVSKDGYETVQTYPPFPISAFNPIDAHLSVSQSSITSKIFLINKTSHINLHFADIHGTNLPNLSFSLVGGRVIGTTVASAPVPVYFYNEPTLTCDANGLWSSPALGMGPYKFAITNPVYDLITTSLVSPWSLAPDSTLAVEILMGLKTENMLVVSAKEVGGQIPVVDATVTITDSLGAPFQTSTTDINGIAYFPLTENPPKTFTPAATYNVDITKEGYNPGHTTAIISGITRSQTILTKP